MNHGAVSFLAGGWKGWSCRELRRGLGSVAAVAGSRWRKGAGFSAALSAESGRACSLLSETESTRGRGASRVTLAAMGPVHGVGGGALARILRRATGRRCGCTDAATGRSEARARHEAAVRIVSRGALSRRSDRRWRPGPCRERRWLGGRRKHDGTPICSRESDETRAEVALPATRRQIHQAGIQMGMPTSSNTARRLSPSRSRRASCAAISLRRFMPARCRGSLELPGVLHATVTVGPGRETRRDHLLDRLHM